MDAGVRLTLPKAGAFGENTISKNEGSLDEKLILVQIRGIQWECYFWSFSERFKSRDLKKKKSLKMAKMINLSMKLKQKVASVAAECKIGGLRWERSKSQHFTKKCGVFMWQQRQSAKIWGHWVTAALKIGVFGALQPRHLHNGSVPPPSPLHVLELHHFHINKISLFYLSTLQCRSTQGYSTR